MRLTYRSLADARRVKHLVRRVAYRNNFGEVRRVIIESLAGKPCDHFKLDISQCVVRDDGFTMRMEAIPQFGSLAPVGKV